MSFVKLDGFEGRVMHRVSASDTYLRLRTVDIAPLKNIAAGDYTWLVLSDDVSREIVKFTDAAGIVDVGHGLSDVPVGRQLAGTKTAFNYAGCHRTRLVYEITSEVVEEIVAAALLAKGIV